MAEEYKPRKIKPVSQTHEEITGHITQGESAFYNLIDNIRLNKANLDPQTYQNMISNLKIMNKVKDKVVTGVDEISDFARTDVTGLIIKSEFNAIINENKLARPVAVVVADIDNLGPYNKKYGHDQGDILIDITANAFKNGLTSKLKGDERIIAGRLGGDEYIAFISKFKRGPEDLEKIVEHVRSTIETTELPGAPEAKDFPDDKYQHASMSLGATISKDDDTLSFLKYIADTGFMKTKQKKKNSVTMIKNE